MVAIEKLFKEIYLNDLFQFWSHITFLGTFYCSKIFGSIGVFLLLFYTVCDTLVDGVIVMSLVVTTLEYCVVVVVIVDSNLKFFLLLVGIVGVTFRDDDYFIFVVILNI